jgi:hypothetical protein
VPSDPGPEHVPDDPFFVTGGRYYTLLRYSEKVGVTTLKTIVAWQYYLQFRSVLNCWFKEELYNDLKNLMSINQYGFIENRSTITNLLVNASFVLNSIEDGNQVNSIYTNFSKACASSTVAERDVCGYRARKMHVPGILSVKENSENKNR